jgi:hypothetical protein
MYTTQPEQIEQLEPPEFPVFSTVNVSTVDSGNVDQELDPFPGAGSFVPSFADPDGLVGSAQDAIILAIHATDPGIGFPDVEEEFGFGGPGNPDFFDSAIGFTILEPGEHTDVSVPIFAFDGVETAIGRIPEGGTYPPNPNGETEVVAQLWTPALPEEVDNPVLLPSEFSTQPVPSPYGFDVQLLTVDGQPVRDGATVTDLNQSDLDPLGQPELAVATTDSTTESSW